jgi:CubicO group peptidase (beta-lactamase class C family)
LGKFYESLLGLGTQLLKGETIAEFTQRHRVGLFDHTFQHVIDFGLGFIVNSNGYGVETVPYGYGRHASDEAFGHSGAQSSCAFADPAHQLAVAWSCNGLPGERLHQRRAREINSAIYEDVGLA